MRHGEGGGVFPTVSSWMLDFLNQAEGETERPDHCAVWMEEVQGARQSQATSTCHYQHERRAGPNDGSIGIQSIDIPFINPSWVSL